MSETVVVQFFGICTDITLPKAHFVLLPHASQSRIDGEEVLRRHDVKPHVSWLRILNEEVRSYDVPPHHRTEDVSWWRLDGVRLSIRDAFVPDTPPPTPQLPLLTAYTSTEVELRPECDGRETPRAEITDCIFDFSPEVTVVPMQNDEGKEGERATVGVVTVATPAAPTLQWQHFGANTTSAIILKSGAQITVFSYPERSAAEDKNADFLLHFLSMTEVPADSWFPPARPWQEATTRIGTRNPPKPPTAGDPGGVFTGPGCSNSAYP